MLHDVKIVIDAKVKGAFIGLAVIVAGESNRMCMSDGSL